MEDNTVLQLKSQPSVIAHVEMMQGIINRLADNSAKCKEWCFALIAALIVFLFSSENEAKIDFRILYFIIGIFCVLDAYYLGLERNLKSHLSAFVEKLNNNDDTDLPKDIFLPYGHQYKRPCLFEKLILQLWWTLCSLTSFSILVPYGLIILATWIFTP